MKLVIAFFTLVIVIVLVAVAPAGAKEIALIYSGNLDGELEPCGCSPEGDFGGILRRATMLDELRSKEPNLVLISSGGLLTSEVGSDRIKNDFILQGFETLGYDAIGVQWQDLTHGLGFLGKTSLPFVASNLLSDEAVKSVAIKRSGKILRYLQWLDPNTSPYKQMKTPIISERLSELKERLARAKADGETTILGTTLTVEEAQASLPLELIDILIIGANYEIYGEPQMLSNTLIVQPGSRGMRLGKLVLSLGKGGDIKKWDHSIVQLPKSIEDAPRLAGWYQTYNEAIKKDYQQRVALRKAKASGQQSPFVGAEGCMACHKTGYEVWSKTDHARAFDDLEAVSKSFDPNCLQCHTLAMGQDGGFLDQHMTPDFINVQCESCHGAGRKHTESGGTEKQGLRKSDPASICTECHNQSHSPSFDFKAYWPKIQHQKEPHT